MMKRAIVLGCLVLLAAGLAWSADDSFEMPVDMQKLLPADPAFIVAVTSVNDLDRHWRTIEDSFDDGAGGKTDVVGMLSQHLPRFAEYASLDRPLAMALGLPDLMSGEEPAFTFVLPITDAFDEEIRQEMMEEGITPFVEGEYLAFSIDPEFTPAGSAPALARGLKPGFISASLDLEMVIAAYRPLAEMGLDALANAPALPDSAAADTAPPAPYMDPEEGAALQDMSLQIMDSARRLDLAFRVEGEELTLHSGFSVFPGSPLDPGPQPSFETALQLTRLLPEGGNIIQTMALDQTRQFEVFRNYYTANLEKAAADMPPEQGAAYLAWVRSYLDSIDLFANPLAASITMSAEGIATNMVMECADAAADLERFAQLFAGLSAAEVGLSLTKMPTGKVAGVEVRSWTVEYDADKLAALSDDPLNPQMGGAGRLQAEQMIAMLRKVMPSINMAARGDYLILSADNNSSNLVHMIQLAGQRRGAAHPGTAAIAAKVGPACQQVVTGDLMAILAWVTEWMEELEDEEFAAIEGNPIPFTSALTIDGADYGMDWTMDMSAVKNFIQVMQELEALDDQSNNDTDAADSAEVNDVDEVDEPDEQDEQEN